MRLSELNPKLEGTLVEGMLDFDCPLGHPHRIMVPVGKYGDRSGWKPEGEYPESLTLTPSILAHTAFPSDQELMGDAYEAASTCGWHGWIRAGEIVNA